ncbi:ATP-binding protein [Streptomyces sp. ALI-76-A]|uniref:ATP-binding protein n=1 Tax=Streptomyces sp. ALI-76-A TaxID=3025736 RepID=UPI00256ED97C|nr:ATP-binding protein [Streptomyces sp. ALI-76-A]MDL5199298.1 ATP-binding protein [Streptomyces sp. ALI-76-A]
MRSPEEDYGFPAGGSPPLTAERARNMTRGFLSVLAPEGGDQADSVPLVVPELVGNAERHAGGATGFDLAARPGTVTVTAKDASTAWPRPRRTDASEPGGLGRHLIQEPALEVRVDAGPAGKTVSAVLPLPHGLGRARGRRP